MAEIFLNLMKYMYLHNQGSQQDPNRINSKNHTKHIMIKLLKTKNREYWKQKERTDRSLIKLTADLSSETIKVRR